MSAREDSLTPISSPSPPPTTPNPLKTYNPGAVAAAATMESNPPPSTRFYGIRSWMSQAFVASFMAGGVAGAVSRTVVSPLERLKILLQVQSGGSSEYKIGIWQALKKIWREEGMKGMMAGNGTNCIRIVPYSAVQFGSYNIYKPLVSLFLFFLGVGGAGRGCGRAKQQWEQQHRPHQQQYSQLQQCHQYLDQDQRHLQNHKRQPRSISASDMSKLTNL